MPRSVFLSPTRVACSQRALSRLCRGTNAAQNGVSSLTKLGQTTYSWSRPGVLIGFVTWRFSIAVFVAPDRTVTSRKDAYGLRSSSESTRTILAP
jgi:hypothetical protein